MKRFFLLGTTGIAVLLFLLFSIRQTNAQILKFAVLSDIHFSLHGSDSGLKMLDSGRRLLPGLLQEINEMSDVDFVIFSGDLFVDPLWPELKELVSILKKELRKPFYVIPGNHDRRMIGQTQEQFSLADFVKAFQGHPYFSSSPSFWSLDFGP